MTLTIYTANGRFLVAFFLAVMFFQVIQKLGHAMMYANNPLIRRFNYPSLCSHRIWIQAQHPPSSNDLHWLHMVLRLTVITLFAAEQAPAASSLYASSYHQGHERNDENACRIVQAHTHKLSVTHYDRMAPFSMLAITKIAEKQDEWSALARIHLALQIMPRAIRLEY